MEKEKLAYESPELEIIEIVLEDIVTASPPVEDKEPNPDDMDDWW